MFEAVFDYIDSYFSSDERARIRELETDIVGYQSLLEVLKEDSVEKEKIFNKLDKAYGELLKDYEEALENPSKESGLELELNTKYPKADIQYSGRTFGTTKNRIPIDVRLLITKNDYHIHDILKKKRLYYKKGSMDAHILKVYHWIKKDYYRYVYDKTNYGVSEFWEFPFEILEGLEKKYIKGADCDSWAHFITSFLIASGVPDWKVRVVIGTCALGGHSTVYVYCDKTNKFHHINSTMGAHSNYTKLEKYPTTDDADSGKDRLGIKNVWFSFNDKYAWHKFTSEAKNSFKKRKANKLFVIK